MIDTIFKIQVRQTIDNQLDIYYLYFSKSLK